MSLPGAIDLLAPYDSPKVSYADIGPPEPGTWWVPQTPRAKPRYVRMVGDGRVFYETEAGVKDHMALLSWRIWVASKQAMRR